MTTSFLHPKSFLSVDLLCGYKSLLGFTFYFITLESFLFVLVSVQFSCCFIYIIPYLLSHLGIEFSTRTSSYQRVKIKTATFPF